MTDADLKYYSKEIAEQAVRRISGSEGIVVRQIIGVYMVSVMEWLPYQLNVQVYYGNEWEEELVKRADLVKTIMRLWRTVESSIANKAAVAALRELKG